MSIIGKQTLSNKLVEVGVIAAVFAVFLIAIKSAYGAGSLEELQSQTMQEQSYRSELINFINQSNLYGNDTSSNEDLLTEREKFNYLLPSLSLERLEELAKAIRSGNPYSVLADIQEEKLAPHLERFQGLLNSDD